MARLDAGNLLLWTITDGRKASSASIAMYRIVQYLSAARLQMERFQECLRRAERGDHSALGQAFSELHFYLICWNTIGDMIDVVRLSSGFAGARSIYRVHRMTLETYAKARDDLEHYTERLRGHKKGRPLKEPSDLGNLLGGSFSLGEEQVDVSPASLTLLEKIVRDFTAKVRSEGLARYQEKRNLRKSTKGLSK